MWPGCPQCVQQLPLFRLLHVLANFFDGLASVLLGLGCRSSGLVAGLLHRIAGVFAGLVDGSAGIVTGLFDRVAGLLGIGSGIIGGRIGGFVGFFLGRLRTGRQSK